MERGEKNPSIGDLLPLDDITYFPSPCCFNEIQAFVIYQLEIGIEPKSFTISTNPFTDVGAYSAAVSPYGTYDQNGNVWEWDEALASSFYRGLRGGSWSNFSVKLAASNRVVFSPSAESKVIGFRVASIPEPSTSLLGMLATVGLLMRRRRLKDTITAYGGVAP